MEVEDGLADTKGVSAYWCWTYFPDPDLVDTSNDDDVKLHMATWLAERKSYFTTGNVVRYSIAGFEKCPNTGHYHWQGYTELFSTAKKRLAGMKKYFQDDRVHFSIRRGTRDEARNYCKKENDFDEFGIWISGSGARSDLSSVTDMIKEGKCMREVAVEAPETYVRYSRGLEKLSLLLNPPEYRDDVKCYCIYGPSGAGKSTAFKKVEARLKNEGHRVFHRSHEGNWYDGYDGQDIIFYDDFDDDIPFKLLLKYTSGCPTVFSQKGAFVPSKVTQFWFTSNVHPRFWYMKDPYNQGQLIWRFNKGGVYNIPDAVVQNQKWDDDKDINMAI